MNEPPERKCPVCGQLRPLLSVTDAAYTAGVTRKTIYRWVESGKLPHCVLPSGLIRISPESLLRIQHLRNNGKPDGGHDLKRSRSRLSGKKKSINVTSAES